MKTILSKNNFFAFCVPLFIFFAFAIIHIGTMGINIDEAVSTLGVKDLVLQMKDPLHIPSNLNYWKQILIGGFYFPLSFSEYTGSLNLYFSALFAYFDFRSIFLFRISCVFIGALGIIVIYKTLKLWLNKETSYLVFLLLCLNPTYINGAKIGQYTDESTSIVLLWLGLLWLTFYYKRQKSRFLYAAFFIFGIAVWTKLSFGGYLIGLFAIWAVFSLKNKKLFAKKRHLFTGSLLFLIGLSPILYENYESLLYFKNTMLSGGTQSELDLLYLAKLRSLQIIGLISNNVLPCFTDYFSYEYLYRADVLLTLGGFIYLLFFLNKEHKQFLIIFFIFYVITTLLMFLTPTEPFASHIILIMPLPQIIMALLFLQFYKKAAFKKFVILIFALLLVRDIYVNAMLISDIKNNRVYRDFSATLYPSIEWMDKHESNVFYSAAQLLNAQAITALSYTDTKIYNYKDYSPPQDMAKWIDQRIPKDKPFYLLEQKADPTCKKFRDVLLANNYIFTLKDTITTGPDEIYIYFVSKS